MSVLSVAFYGEGAGSEYVFLKQIVQRTLEDLLPHIEILIQDIRLIEAATQTDKLIAAAQKAKGYGLLVFHLDGDSRNWEAAYRRRFQPGIEAVQATSAAIQDVVPIIPVKMTEAWMLVDFEAFKRVTYTREDNNFPARPHQVEAVDNPKAIINAAVAQATQGRRRRIPITDVYLPLADQLDMTRLARVPAYQRFQQHLADALANTPQLRYLGFEPPTNMSQR